MRRHIPDILEVKLNDPEVVPKNSKAMMAVRWSTVVQRKQTFSKESNNRRMSVLFERFSKKVLFLTSLTKPVSPKVLVQMLCKHDYMDCKYCKQKLKL